MIKNSGMTGLPELGSIYKFLKSPANVIGSGIGGIAGAMTMSSVLRSIDHAVTWKKVVAMHGHDMAGWEGEALEIFKKLIKFSPEVIREPELAWGMIANVHRVGGMSYPVAKSIMSTEQMFNQPQMFIPDVSKALDKDWEKSEYQKRHPKNSAAANSGSLIKGGAAGALTNKLITPLKVGGQKALKFIGDAWKPALLGAAITGGSTYGVHAGASGYHSIMRERGWSKFKSKYPKAIDGWEPQAKELFDVLYKSSPAIANDPEIALNFVSHMRDQGGLDFGTMADLAALRKGRADRSKDKAKVISEIIGVPYQVAR